MINGPSATNLPQRNNHEARIRSKCLFGTALGLAWSAAGQPFSIESIKHESLGKDILGNSLGEIITLRWETVPERVWSIESSTNLIDWSQAQAGPDALYRVPSSHSNHTEFTFDAPPESTRFYRVRKLPMTDINHAGSLTPDDFGMAVTYDANDHSRVVGAFDPYDRGIGFTWAPGESIVTFGPKSSPSAVNNQNMVVGYRYNSSSGEIFSWTPSGGIVEMGPGVGVDVNEAGHIIGYEVNPHRSFFWKPSTGRIYINPGATTFAGALSDAGHVVGTFRTQSGEYHAFIWTEEGGMLDLGGFNSGAVDVNNNGQVIGTRELQAPGTVARGFFWSAATGFVNFPEGSTPVDINDQGQVIMHYRNRGFVWSQSQGLVDLGTFGLDTTPTAINDLGQIVGDSTYVDGNLVYHKPFFWSPGTGMVGLETLAARQPGVFQINNSGVAFGNAYTANYQAIHAVMWDPIVPP